MENIECIISLHAADDTSLDNGDDQMKLDMPKRDLRFTTGHKDGLWCSTQRKYIRFSMRNAI
jgi:hypothetical protein